MPQRQIIGRLGNPSDSHRVYNVFGRKLSTVPWVHFKQPFYPEAADKEKLDGLTDKGQQIVKKLMTDKGISSVYLQGESFIQITPERNASWRDVEPFFRETIGTVLDVETELIEDLGGLFHVAMEMANA